MSKKRRMWSEEEIRSISDNQACNMVNEHKRTSLGHDWFFVCLISALIFGLSLYFIGASFKWYDDARFENNQTRQPINCVNEMKLQLAEIANVSCCNTTVNYYGYLLSGNVCEECLIPIYENIEVPTGR